MPKTELFVSLKVPDNVAITAFHAIERMGFHELEKLERFDYYSFDFSGDEKKFQEKIKEIDILVNANKHIPGFELEQEENTQQVLVQDEEKSDLKEKLIKLGIKNINRVEKGVLWKMHFKPGTNIKTRSEEITKNLLMNEHYQRFTVLK